MSVLSFGRRRVGGGRRSAHTGGMHAIPDEPTVEAPIHAAEPAGTGLTPAEVTKDTAQSVTVAAATMVGEVSTIVTGAVRAVANSVGNFATEVFEIRESARRANADQSADRTDRL